MFSHPIAAGPAGETGLEPRTRPGPIATRESTRTTSADALTRTIKGVVAASEGMADADGPETESGPVSVDVDVENGRTVVSVTGERDAAVIVHSESGERIYLPPEQEATDGENPYRPGERGTPYEGLRGEASPYESGRPRNPSVGMIPRSNGFRIVHPEPVTDLRLLR